MGRPFFAHLKIFLIVARHRAYTDLYVRSMRHTGKERYDMESHDYAAETQRPQDIDDLIFRDAQDRPVSQR